jgi:cytochrome P450
MALHTSVTTWGPDALDFNPARWICTSTEEDIGETIKTPPRGSYLPWSFGPRTCPGQKMSQVEFVTVIATLFRRCTASPASKQAEDRTEARHQLLALMQDSQPVLTLQMNRPDDVYLSWKSRATSNISA